MSISRKGAAVGFLVGVALVAFAACGEKPPPPLPPAPPAPVQPPAPPSQPPAGQPQQPSQPEPTAPVTTPQPPPAPAEFRVAIKGNAFVPPALTVKAGDTVTWVNEDAILHTVAGAGFGSGTLGQGQTYSFRFTANGTFSYRCGLHPLMTGSIVVQ